MKRFPSEQELHERASLYLKVCARESAPRKKLPRTLNEKILAATVALNQRDSAEAIALLEKATSSHPSDDRLFYMLALAHALRLDEMAAADYLLKAITLNPDNRIQAGEEADFDGIRQTPAFINALSTP
jgi:Tfp pilus assembly protein PilF